MTLMRTGWRRPASRATRSSRSNSSPLSAATSPRPDVTASSSSSSDLLLPCMAIRSGGVLERRATSTSPPVAARTPSPSSTAIRINGRTGNALIANSTRGNDSANARQRARKSSSSTTNRGVPNRAASASAWTPAICRPRSPNAAPVGHGEPATSDVIFDPLHRLRRRYPEEAQDVGHGLLGPGAQPQAGLRQRLVVAHHAAVRVEPVESGGEILGVVGEPVRPSHRRRGSDLARELGNPPHEIELGL